MVQVNYKARLGNNLFQYSIGRIIAESLGLSLHAAPIPGFPGTSRKLRGAEHTAPTVELCGQKINLKSFVSNYSNQKVLINGWFQRYEYYHPHRESIREWLLPDLIQEFNAHRPNIVLNVRRTDYVSLGWALPFSYYANALNSLNIDNSRLWIVTDDPKDPFFLNFNKWPHQFFRGTPIQQLLFMASARALVMSASTFSWWASFLASDQLAICPIPSTGVWSRDGEFEDINLIEEDRFQCHAVEFPYTPTAIESRYQQIRALRRRVFHFLNNRLRISVPIPPP